MSLNPQFPVDLVTSTKEILNGKFCVLCSDCVCYFTAPQQVLDNLFCQRKKMIDNF